MTQPAIDYTSLAQRFITPDVRAVLLQGSRARGDAGEYSDIDLKLFLGTSQPPAPPASYLIDGQLVTVSGATPDEIENWFVDPEWNVAVVQGLRDAHILYDPEGLAAQVQQRARAFVRDAAMQVRAYLWVSAEMAGWVEEVYKGLEGLSRHDVGRMLNARHGFSWGLTRILTVYRGILLSGDNAIIDEVTRVVGAGSRWAILRDAAFGICNFDGTPITIEDQIIAGLELYLETAHMVDDAIQPEHRALVHHAVSVIKHELVALHKAGAHGQ
ncbi:MAG TPA: nucleotidyltransferase domain-containing protein [Anaerolineae bacterium]